MFIIRFTSEELVIGQLKVRGEITHVWAGCESEENARELCEWLTEKSLKFSVRSNPYAGRYTVREDNTPYPWDNELDAGPFRFMDENFFMESWSFLKGK